MKKRKLFCQRNKLCYRISLLKEYLIRDIKTIVSGKKFAVKKSGEWLPNVVKEHRSVLIRELHGVNLQLQQNKVKNLELASGKINGLVIRPGEVFSFWKTVGNTTKRKGYLDGLVISGGELTAGEGGGLCQLANLIHWLVLNSPLEVMEIHHHTDALFPDERRTVPFGTGTSICYKNSDYQFKNTTDQAVQLRLWLNDMELCGELRSEKEFPNIYRLSEENHHFVKEDDAYYRVSQVYKITVDRKSNKELSKGLILNNHSKVIYDISLIPTDQIAKV